MRLLELSCTKRQVQQQGKYSVLKVVFQFHHTFVQTSARPPFVLVLSTPKEGIPSYMSNSAVGGGEIYE